MELSVADGGRQRRCPAAYQGFLPGSSSLKEAKRLDVISTEVPKLDRSMSRRLKELKGGEGSKAEMKEKKLVSHQFRLLDVAMPLLYLWGQLSYDPNLKDSSMADSAVSALQLWNHSFHSVTMHRRENILKQTDPRFQALLLEPNRFNPKECGSLFGRSFLKQMVKEALDDQKLRNLNRADTRTASVARFRNGISNSSRGDRRNWRNSSHSGFSFGSGSRGFHSSNCSMGRGIGRSVSLFSTHVSNPSRDRSC
ncbi:Uncharacterized protein APZ42_001138 [Daphnia magna]|uniref:Uncharacterized protein n=1 Tax=Daphnia magna TaxID=35525 RepID=A0A164J5K0_9CRUS|nr:Uncharacterized protein APZ42_001138 [Daphnia magna]